MDDAKRASKSPNRNNAGCTADVAKAKQKTKPSNSHGKKKKRTKRRGKYAVPIYPPTDLTDRNAFFYVLETPSGLAYAGQTFNKLNEKDPEHRLRQHNGEIKGGAKKTRKCEGEWTTAFKVTGFTNSRQLRQFEYVMTYGFRNGKRRRALPRRISSYLDMLVQVASERAKEKWTSTSTSWDKSQLQIEWCNQAYSSRIK